MVVFVLFYFTFIETETEPEEVAVKSVGGFFFPTGPLGSQQVAASSHK